MRFPRKQVCAAAVIGGLALAAGPARAELENNWARVDLGAFGSGARICDPEFLFPSVCAAVICEAPGVLSLGLLIGVPGTEGAPRDAVIAIDDFAETRRMTDLPAGSHLFTRTRLEAGDPILDLLRSGRGIAIVLEEFPYVFPLRGAAFEVERAEAECF